MTRSVQVEFTDDAGERTVCVAAAAAGAELVTACDEAAAPVEFSCRAACCSTCRVQVLQGAELLTAPGEMEQELITAAGSPADQRFCCAAQLRADATGTLRLRPLGPCF